MAELTGTLDGRVVLITGATAPMGRELIDAFLGAGCKLALCVRRMAHLPELEQHLADYVSRTMIVPCDLRYEENVVRMIHRVVHRFGRLDVIVNAACILGPKLPMMDYPMDPWRDVVATNVTGVYLVCREALPWMVRQKSGSIINVTTSLTTNLKAQSGAYFISNCAIEGLTRLLAAELKGTGVRVNCVDIGTMTSEIRPAGNGNGWVKTFVWLASDEAGGHNGERVRAGE